MTRPDLLVGRAAEVRRIRELVDDLGNGSGRMLWVEGEPGIGKSTLLRVVWAEAERLDCHRFRATAEELAQRFPLRVLLDSLDPQRDVVSIEPQPDATSRADPVMAAVEGLVVHVERLCAQRPVLLVLDDLQFADDASLLVWQRLSRLVDQLPLLLTVGSRPAPRREETTRLRRGVLTRGATLLALDPLPRRAVEELVEAIAGARPGPGLRRLVEHAGGNPLYVRELVDAVRRSGAICLSGADVADVSDESAAAASAESLDAVIEDRLGYLSQPAFELLRTAALLGREFSVSALAAVSGRSPIAMIEVIEEAIAAGVLVESDQRLVFRHGLIQRALYNRLPAGLRAALHRQAAQTLDEAGLGAERVAEQLVLTDAVDAWFVDWLTRCAELLAYRATHIAADLLERGIAALGPNAPERPQLEAHLATAMFQLHRYEEVEALTRRAILGTADPSRRARLVWTRAYALVRRTRLDDALDVLSEAIGTLDGVSAAWQARLRALQALVLTNTGEHERSERLTGEILDAGPVDSMATGFALHSQFMMAIARRQMTTAMDRVSEALTIIGDEPEAIDLRMLLLSNRAALTVHLDRPAEANAAIAELLSTADRVATPQRLAMSRLQAVELWTAYGRWDDALAELEALEPDDVIEVHTLLRLQMHGLHALIAEHRADDALADRHLAVIEGHRLADSGHVHHSVHLLMAQALRAERRGDVAGARSYLRVLCDPVNAEEFNQVPLWLPDVVRLALAEDDRKTAAEAAATAADTAARVDTPSTIALDEWCAGLCAGDPGPLLRAAERLGQGGRGFDRARVLEDAAVLLSARGDLPAARAQYTAASEVYAELGATWDAHRAASRLRAHGVQRGRRRQRDRPTTGWAALTPTELQVSALVAEGLPNPEIASRLFLSRRTVETHISHILMKLNARSRVEIAREAARNEP